MSGIRLRFLLGLAFLSACNGREGEDLCSSVSTSAVADTAIRFTVDGREVLFSIGEGGEWTLDTIEHILSLRNSRYEGPYTGRTIELAAIGFSGARNYQVGEFQGVVPAGVEVVPREAVGRFWCSAADGTTRMMVSAGMVGDSLHVTSFDSVTGLVEGNFRFHLREWHGNDDRFLVSDGHFRGTVTRMSVPPGDVATEPGS